ncbi:hypothetical protein A7E78_04780 [Syntrophotalea acetylenivorans]|uniref:Uncharacterized protein n=1 Tax=Syntrophotalea acetylenivorans TaxID=1842532 RepID=A0A1L3GMU1_9BACT|nr:hypothetical protein [Syntrophotalea acetylenivorans]APG27210.1 hypothetical protein A7E78_04780 [Syntrophotalea acetylenivorans]
MIRPGGVTDKEWGKLRAQLVWEYAKTVPLKKVKLNNRGKVNRDQTLVHVLNVGKNAKYHEGVKAALAYLDDRLEKVSRTKRGVDHKTEGAKALMPEIQELANQADALKVEVNATRQQYQIEEWFLGAGRILRP